MRESKLIMRITSILALSFCLSACQEARKELTKDDVGISATLTVSMVSEAQKACLKIGKEDIVECSKYQGELPEEKLASRLTNLAFEQFDKYTAECQKFYVEQYCTELLDRAAKIKYRE